MGSTTVSTLRQNSYRSLWRSIRDMRLVPWYCERCRQGALMCFLFFLRFMGCMESEMTEYRHTSMQWVRIRDVVIDDVDLAFLFFLPFLLCGLLQ